MAKIRVALCNMQVSQEKAIDLQDFRRAEELKAEIKDKRDELESMENATKPQADPEVEMVCVSIKIYLLQLVYLKL